MKRFRIFLRGGGSFEIEGSNLKFTNDGVAVVGAVQAYAVPNQADIIAIAEVV